MAQTFFFPFLAFAAQVAYGIMAAVGFRIYKHYNPIDDEEIEMDKQDGVHNEAFN